MGETLATKILGNLYKVKEVPLARFVAGFNIEGVGALIMDKVVAAGYDSLGRLREADGEALAEIDGIGEVLGRTIAKGIRELAEKMDAVLAGGRISIASPGGGALRGRSFCFTGSLKSMTRSQAQDRVREVGGVVVSSVTKDLAFLVTNDPSSGSSKNRKAEELGVQVVSEEDFLTMIDATQK
jgi:DNA ligase (NAD+)